MQILSDREIFRSETLTFYMWLLYFPELKIVKKAITLALSLVNT